MEHTKKSLLPILVLLCGTVAVIALVFAGVTLSRYLIEDDNPNVAVPSQFYFLSNYLTEPTEGEDGEIVYTNYTVYTSSVTITVKNNDGINIAEDNITYTIQAEAVIADTTEDATVDATEDATGDTTVDFTDSNNTVAESYILSNNESAGSNSYSYTLTAEENDSITVIANSTAPYTQQLGATFNFVNPGDFGFYYVEDQGYYTQVHVFTGQDVGDITISYSDNFAPNNMDPWMDDWLDASHGTIDGNDLEPNAYYCFVFFETMENVEDNIDYSDMNQTQLAGTAKTTITIGAITATEGS